MLENTPNQPSNSRTKNWVKIDDESRGTYSTNSQIKLKTTMLRSSLCDYSDGYLFVTGTIKVPILEQQLPQITKIKNQYLQNCASFTDCIMKSKKRKYIILRVLMQQ